MGAAAAVMPYLISAASAVGGAAIAAKAAKKGPQLDSVEKQVMPNDENALRAAQDAARRRRGISANILAGEGGTAGSVATKTALGQ